MFVRSVERPFVSVRAVNIRSRTRYIEIPAGGKPGFEYLYDVRLYEYLHYVRVYESLQYIRVYEYDYIRLFNYRKLLNKF